MSTLVVGVPSEIKDNENRVALTPDGVVELVHDGHEVVVQAGAGAGSRFADDEYAAAGAKVVPTPDEVFDAADRPLWSDRGHRPAGRQHVGRTGSSNDDQRRDRARFGSGGRP